MIIFGYIEYIELIISLEQLPNRCYFKVVLYTILDEWTSIYVWKIYFVLSTF